MKAIEPGVRKGSIPIKLSSSDCFKILHLTPLLLKLQMVLNPMNWVLAR